MDGSGIFVPGWGAPASLYRLPADWSPLPPPGFRGFSSLRRWLGAELAVRGKTAIGGHSMGAALAIAAAADTPHLVERLVLVAPAGLPLTKPIRKSLRDLAAQLATGLYPAATFVEALTSFVRAPASAIALARELRRLDLTHDCARVRAASVPVLVVGCATDTLVPAAQARMLARLLDAEYREVDLAGGHMWMLGEPSLFGTALS